MSDINIPPQLRALANELEDADHERLTPPPSIWAGIEAGVAADAASEIATVAPTETDVVSLDARRASRAAMPKIMAIAAAFLLIAGIAVAALLPGDDGPDRTLVASTAITSDGLPLAADAGVAELVDVDGRYELQLDLDELPEADGFYEVWIIDTNVEGMFSLGVVQTDGDGRFALPDGVDPANFPVIDISAEPIDGDPTHSGQSILRGVLEL